MQVKIIPLLLLLAFVSSGCSQKMTPQRFHELVATPGDNVPLSPILTSGSPYWSNSVATMVIKFASGDVVTGETRMKCKTIGGKYIVYSMESKLYNQKAYGIMTFDDKAGPLKVYALINDVLDEVTLVYDTQKKTYTESPSTYGDGFVETTTGSYSDTEDDTHTVVYQHGALFMTNDTTNRPVSSSQ